MFPSEFKTGRKVCKCTKAKITRDENNPVNSILLRLLCNAVLRVFSKTNVDYNKVEQTCFNVIIKRGLTEKEYTT